MTRPAAPTVKPGQVWKDRHGIAYTVVRLDVFCAVLADIRGHRIQVTPDAFGRALRLTHDPDEVEP